MFLTPYSLLLCLCVLTLRDPVVHSTYVFFLYHLVRSVVACPWLKNVMAFEILDHFVGGFTNFQAWGWENEKTSWKSYLKRSVLRPLAMNKLMMRKLQNGAHWSRNMKILKKTQITQNFNVFLFCAFNKDTFRACLFSEKYQWFGVLWNWLFSITAHPA